MRYILVAMVTLVIGMLVARAEDPPAMKPVVVTEQPSTMKVKRSSGGFTIKVTVGDQSYEESSKGTTLEIEAPHSDAAKVWETLERDRKDRKQEMLDSANRVAKESGKMVREPKVVVVPAPAAPATSSCCGGGSCATTGQPLCGCASHLRLCRVRGLDPLTTYCLCTDTSMCGRNCSCRRAPATSCSTSCRRFAPCAAPSVLPCALPASCTGVQWYWSASYRYYVYHWNGQYYWYYRNSWAVYPYIVQ